MPNAKLRYRDRNFHEILEVLDQDFVRTNDVVKVRLENDRAPKRFPITNGWIVGIRMIDSFIQWYHWKYKVNS